MMRLYVTPVNRSLTVLTGYGSRELVVEIRNGRPPMWSSSPRGWAVQPSTADDVVALAESRGFLVVIREAVDGRT